MRVACAMLAHLRGLSCDGAPVAGMMSIVVMPCLNEVHYVDHAIASLLGAAADAPLDAQLVVVDNGSSDGTLDLLSDVAKSFAGRVHILEERRRGFVPPRDTGVRAAAAIADNLGLPPEDVLILQADADTIYQNGYIAIMERAAEGTAGFIFEGAAKYPWDFATGHPDYVRAERLVDLELESGEASDEDDVVVDDKICAYLLSDYVRWGGLQEETDDRGDQIHAETTRMYIRARLESGATKCRVNPAGAASSRRRVAENPRYQFATMGFPREASWSKTITAVWKPVEIDIFGKAVIAGLEPQAVFLRRAHLLALFRFLPAALLAAQSRPHPLLAQADVAAVVSHMPRWSVDELTNGPGEAIVTLLRLIDTNPELFAFPHSFDR